MLNLNLIHILQSNQNFMKNFIIYLITTIVLLSCKKKTEIQPESKNKNIGVWVGLFDGKKSALEIRENKLILDQDMYFNSSFRNENEIVTNQLSYNYTVYIESYHYIFNDTLFLNLQMLDKKYKTGKFLK